MKKRRIALGLALLGIMLAVGVVLAGSSPNYARFFPATMSAFGDVRLAAADEVTIQFGLRADAFRAGLDFSRDRGDFLAPIEQTEWNVTFSPRLGVSAPVPGMDGAELRSLGILIIEVGIGLAVMAILVAIYDDLLRGEADG